MDSLRAQQCFTHHTVYLKTYITCWPTKGVFTKSNFEFKGKKPPIFFSWGEYKCVEQLSSSITKVLKIEEEMMKAHIQYRGRRAAFSMMVTVDPFLMWKNVSRPDDVGSQRPTCEIMSSTIGDLKVLVKGSAHDK